MRGTLKTSTLESKFPLLRVENNCIISKFADITAAYRVLLPELFTLTGEEYEALHGAWLKALKVLPDYTVVHKQDFFIEERYTAPEEGSERSFLARSYERHFNERPYLRHTCYLFVTKTTPERMRQTSASSVLCRGFIVPREMRDTDAVTRFLEAAEQMERILNDSGLVHVERLTETEIVGTADDAGLLARYFALSDERRPVVNEDIRLDPDVMRIGDKYLSMHTLSDLDVPGRTAVSSPPAAKPDGKPRTLYVRIPGADHPLCRRVKLLLTMFPGNERIVLYMEDTKKRLGAPCLIHPAFVAELEEQCGKENVVVK